jgi:hypothetical protein
LLDEDSEQLRTELEKLKAAREERERKLKEVNDPPLREIKRDRRHIPGIYN